MLTTHRTSQRQGQIGGGGGGGPGSPGGTFGESPKFHKEGNTQQRRACKYMPRCSTV